MFTTTRTKRDSSRGRVTQHSPYVNRQTVHCTDQHGITDETLNISVFHPKGPGSRQIITLLIIESSFSLDSLVTGFEGGNGL